MAGSGAVMWMIGKAALVALAVALPAVVHAQPAVTARGAIIVDAETGSVIWEKNADEPLPPASTTKVMTAVLALQSHRLDEHFPVSANAASTPPSKIGLRPGQSVSLHDLLFAVLLKSANDAAVVVAEGVSGSEAAFAQQMNLKARVIGAVSTNFENPHGLTEGGHLTTARDLSRIFRYGLGVPGFREVLYTSSAGVEIDGPRGRYTTVRSHNRLLNAPDYQVIGKTGYTRAARRCYVGAAGYGSREVVIALLGSTDLWGDARRMLHYGLQSGRPTPVLTAARTPPPPPAAPIAAPPPAPDEPPPAAPAYRAAPQPEYRPPPQPEYRAAAPEPDNRATQQADYRTVPPPPARAVPPPAPTPAEAARTDQGLAPQAAIDRASRMARAQPDAAPAAPANTYDGYRPDDPGAPTARAYVPATAPANDTPGGRREIIVDEAPMPGQAIDDPEPAAERTAPTRTRAAAAAAGATAAAAPAGSDRRRAPATKRPSAEVATRGTTRASEGPSSRTTKSRTAPAARRKPTRETASTTGRDWSRSRSQTRTPTTTARKGRDTRETTKRPATDPAPSKTAAPSSKSDAAAKRATSSRATSKAAVTAQAETTKATKKTSTSRKEAEKSTSTSRVSGQKPTKKR